MSAPPKSQDHQLLRRRNSIPTSIAGVPTNLTLLPHSCTTTTSSSPSSSSYSFPSDDQELLAVKPSSQSYTSLKDLLPTVTVNSPRPQAARHAQSPSIVCIRNRLVNQAARAYLQPVSITTPTSAGANFLYRFWPPLSAIIDFVLKTVVRAFHWTLRVIRFQSSS